jgi:hypothetical protein
MQVRRVRLRGEFSWKKQDVFLTETLIGETIGLLPIDERFYTVYFAALPIARFDSRRLLIVRQPNVADFCGMGYRERGRLPFPCTPPPQPTGGKSVRDVPGLKCQTCPRPHIISPWRGFGQRLAY